MVMRVILALLLFVTLSLACSQPVASETNVCAGQCPTINGAFDPSTNVICKDGTTYVPTCLFNGTSCGCQWRFPTLDDCASSTTPCTSASSCLITCSPITCQIACPNGRKRDSNNCEICECLPSDTPTPTDKCFGIMCPMVACAETQTAAVTGDSCCPQCFTVPPQCLVACSEPPSSCPTGTVPSVDVCGCTSCVTAPVCSATLCPEVACALGSTTVKLPDECCNTCKPVLNCSLVDCAPPLCGPNQSLKVVDGQCCPVCEEATNCALAGACQPSQCGDGFEQSNVDGFCCPICVPKNKCASVICPMYACATERTSLRDGSCCFSCSPCLEKETGEKVCDRNDNLICRPGFEGENCDKPVTSALNRHDFEIKVLNGSVVTSGEKALWIILNRVRSIPREWLEVHQARKRATTNSVISFSLTCYSAETNCPNAMQTLQSGMTAESSMQLVTTTSAAVASSLFSLTLIVALLFIVLM